MVEYPFVKAHAYGNDFLFIEASTGEIPDASAVAQAACDRHRGIGGDGLIVYQPTPTGARMTLYNADGGVAEVSGNGVRCLAAILAERTGGSETRIETDGGIKTLTLLIADPPRYRFRAFMGEPLGITERRLEAAGEGVTVVTLSVGNPQCLVLTDTLDPRRFERLGPALATHPAFPDGTNVELVTVETPQRLRILIWERGVGATAASGTGACASAVAAAVYGGAERTVDVVSPGGTQRVEWTSDGLHLTGWAEITIRGRWTRRL